MRPLCVEMSCLAEVRAAFLVVVVIIVLIIIALIVIMTIMRTFRPKYSETENRTWRIKVLIPDQGMPQKERYNSADHEISLVVNTVLNFVFIPTSSVLVVSKKKEVTLRYIPHMTQICFGIPPELEEIRVSGPPDWGFYPQLIPSRFNVRVITVGSMMTGEITKKLKLKKITN